MKFLRGLLLNNVVIKIVSLVLAIFTWMYVARQLYIEDIAKEKDTTSIIEISGEKMIVKKLPIYVSIEGSPMKGHRIALDKIIVTPSHSVLAGSPAVLENLSYIPTEPVNIEGANGTVRRNVKIMPIPKCKAGYEGFVSVTVSIVKDKRVSAQ